MFLRLRLVAPLLLCLIYYDLKAQSVIEGHLIIDTAIWKPIAYLSLIEDLDKLNTMSNEMIIDAVRIDPAGRFVFKTIYFPQEDHLFRIHVAKQSDPPASLNIGGIDENFLFLIANNRTNINIEDNSKVEFIKDVSVKGYYPNSILKQVNLISDYLDSTSFYGSSIKNDLIKRAVFEKLRTIADTCSNPIVSLYAIYKCDFEKNYPVNQQFYRDFLKKWNKDKSAYFTTFKKKFPDLIRTPFPITLIIGLFCILIGFLSCLLYLRFIKRKNYTIQDLSLQERKIYAMVLDGKSNKEIAEALMIEVTTVKSHLSSIYSKLNINSRKDILNSNLDK